MTNIIVCKITYRRLRGFNGTDGSGTMISTSGVRERLLQITKLLNLVSIMAQQYQRQHLLRI